MAKDVYPRVLRDAAVVGECPAALVVHDSCPDLLERHVDQLLREVRRVEDGHAADGASRGGGLACGLGGVGQEEQEYG